MIRSVICMLSLLVFNAHMSGSDMHGLSNLHKQSRKMKILVAVWRFPTLSETFVVNQIIGLIDQGHDVSIYALENKRDTTLVNNDITAYDLLARTYYEKLPRDIDSYDAIICQFGTVGIEILNKLKKRPKARAKIATFFRGNDISAFFARNPGAYTKLFKEGDLFLADCDFFRKRLLSLGVDPTRIAINYSSIQCSRFKYSDHPITDDGLLHVITISRLTPKKGIEDALRAMQKVMMSYPQVTYTIVGDGILRDKLKQLAHDLGIAHRVTFAGAKTPIEIAQYLERSHIFVLPCIVAPDSDVDAMPTVLKEAMSCGLPLVSTYVSGIPELIEDGKTGYLVQQHDIPALSEKIALLIEHPEQRHAFGIEGRKVIEEKFDITMNNNELERILLQLTAS